MGIHLKKAYFRSSDTKKISLCLAGIAALPIQRSELRQTRRAIARRAPQRLPVTSRRVAAHNPAQSGAEHDDFDSDQAVAASSIVRDFVPHRINQFPTGKLKFSQPQVPDQFDYLRTYQDLKARYNKPVPRGVVALGESRSYSIVKGEQPPPQEEFPSTTATYDETTEVSATETTTLLDDTIISVRVSSSVGKSVQPQLEPASLLTEEHPYATAVQRSHFSVDESYESMPHTTFAQGASQQGPSVSFSSTQDPQPVSTEQPATTLGLYPTPVNARTDRSLYLGNSKSLKQMSRRDEGGTERLAGMSDPHTIVVVENSAPVINPLNSPVSYHTSLKSATSGSQVSFYREAPNYRSVVNRPTAPAVELRPTTTTPTVEPQTERLKHETRVETVSYHKERALQQRDQDKAMNQNLNKEKSYQFTNVHDKSYHHVQVTHLDGGVKRSQQAQPSEKRFSQPEKVYGMPEQNYEVDEALSVRTNGRAHGVQGLPTMKPDSNKFGYVVEGRDFKKYRVEERTADGFIVGEYGVVRHDDGSLRGVRYTADSTINPKVIYEALVKFLSL